MYFRASILVALPVLWLTACSGLPVGSGRAGQVTIVNGEFPVLTRGMTLAEIRQTLGEPAEIQPGTGATDVTSEVWVYYLEKSLGRSTVVSGLTGTLGGDFGRAGMGPDYIIAERKLLVTLRLLMVNGRLFAQSAKSDERMEF
ncbi:MAG TPA: hypothetical protein VG734_08650 [Lacunisphaera sp.]|nr:hypothetical protein [Lacunisphaera sp.]